MTDEICLTTIRFDLWSEVRVRIVPDDDDIAVLDVRLFADVDDDGDLLPTVQGVQFPMDALDQLEGAIRYAIGRRNALEHQPDARH